MSRTFIDYNALLERSLRQVVQGALERLAGGPIGEHHFYIAFRTDAAGVVMSDLLRSRYPDSMTIVLQHRFWGLEVDREGFSVNLTFGGRPERLRVPFAAITQFSDPSVNFNLKFPLPGPKPLAPHGVSAESEKPAEQKPDDEAAQIVSLDSFRKK
jgi:hypothetical protein